jgi:hypothetical protein
MDVVNWRTLCAGLTALTEAEVWDLLTAERKGARRSVILRRLHQRYGILRAARERLEIYNEGPSYVR